MSYWQRGLCLLYIFLFSGCGILVKTRATNHHGVETDDFNLPVINYSSAIPSSKRLLLLFSGDGGWLDFEDQLATGFAQKGFHTIGFNSRSYFWDGKTPQQTADDIALLIYKYSTLYNTRVIYLAGYSFGADVVPFIYNRLPEAMKNKVVALELMSPYFTSDFKVHTSDLLNLAGDDRQYKVQPEIEAVNVPIFCFYGEKEDPKPMEKLQKKNFTLKILPGDHHYDISSHQEIFKALRGLRRNQFFREHGLWML
ncbi:type IV secretory pathway VirJ component [Pedobacter cryoconitis]|uniref:Type IV secretory pathway VirJ component n=1 Tax=Pedobacter cryoconitis TaxID=188932 RepID=A0A7W9DJP5_9SPHI|nr:AcvB/VirJ family lysyl-phosphatidylglycerol hydrolase [Pedobacter cryoconitis]MBB5621426.1 type IV secretory pathway VirJ component [Pedobacter cryoconitis]